MAATDSSYELRVSKVGYLNGQWNDWTGEPLTVARSFVSTAKEQRFSGSRTWLTISAVGAATIAFIASHGLQGFGSGGKEGGGPKPAPD
jgi:hypothetical protein